MSNGDDVISSFSEFQNIQGETRIGTVNKKLDCIFAALTEKKDRHEANMDHKEIDKNISEVKKLVNKLGRKVYYISGSFTVLITLFGILFKAGVL